MTKHVIDQFHDFARSKPVEEEYTYCDREACACAQFAEQIGRKEEYRDFAVLVSVPAHIKRMFMPLEVLAMAEPHTFGALAKRIQAAKELELEASFS